MTRPLANLVCTFLLASCAGTPPPVAGLPTGVLHIETDPGVVLVEVSIAETPAARTRGLMGVEELAENAGMVFLEQQPVQQPFWMKNTLIPLSIAFWDQEGRIRVILDMEPCRADPCPLYSPGIAWVGALEVNQGFFAEHGVGVGARVRLER